MISVEFELSPVRCMVSQATNAVCGGDFTVWLSSVEGSSILYGLQIFLICIPFLVLKS